MPTSATREKVRSALLGFAWDQWAQMGVFAPTSRRDPWAADPEALLLLTLEIARGEPRLFDEVLDWLATNGALISRQRLRNLCADEDDRTLTDAALAWAAQHQPALRSAAAAGPQRSSDPARPLFRGSRRSARPDQAFLGFGWEKPATTPTGKSLPPHVELPINFAFRLRHLFGVGSRAEVLRFLLTSRVPGAQAQAVTAAAGYAKRNVLETLNALAASGVVTWYGVANERRYLIDDLDVWPPLLRSEIPLHRDWPQLLRALRILHRWLEDNDLEKLSDYRRASEARMLMGKIEADLTFAGVRVSDDGVGSDYWPVFVKNVEGALAALGGT